MGANAAYYLVSLQLTGAVPAIPRKTTIRGRCRAVGNVVHESRFARDFSPWVVARHYSLFRPAGRTPRPLLLRFLIPTARPPCRAERIFLLLRPQGLKSLAIRLWRIRPAGRTAKARRLKSGEILLPSAYSQGTPPLGRRSLPDDPAPRAQTLPTALCLLPSALCPLLTTTSSGARAPAAPAACRCAV
jgi:hypothetical protein